MKKSFSKERERKLSTNMDFLSQEFQEDIELDEAILMTVAGGINHYVRACTSNECTASCNPSTC